MLTALVNAKPLHPYSILKYIRFLPKAAKIGCTCYTHFNASPKKKTRNFPLNVSEAIANPKPVFKLTQFLSKKHESRNFLKEILLWLSRGGMPGVFGVQNSTDRESLFDTWIETTCTRDLAQFSIPKFNPELGRRILTAIARLEEPTRAEIAKMVGKSSRQIESYLESFKALFVLYEIEPHPLSVGKSRFSLFDGGIANALGAPEQTCLKIWFLNECYSQFSYSGQAKPDVFFYTSSKKSTIDFIVESKHEKFGVILSFEEAPTPYTLRAAQAFIQKTDEMNIVF